VNHEGPLGAWPPWCSGGFGAAYAGPDRKESRTSPRVSTQRRITPVNKAKQAQPTLHQTYRILESNNANRPGTRSFDIGDAEFQEKK
jgi:hypothetical protein